MRIVEDVTSAPLDLGDLHLCIGNFDGIHVGHRAIIERLVSGAQEAGVKSALMTLRPHPAYVFSPETAPKRIRSDGQMAEILEGLGVDALLVMPFDHATSLLSRERFLHEIILGRCAAKHLVLGHDFAFGHKAQGDIPYLREASKEFNFTFDVLDAVTMEGERISSSGIRKLIEAGKLDLVKKYLVDAFAIRGQVLRGRGIGGKSLGFPTANINPSLYVLPPLGIYAAEAKLLSGARQGETFLSALNLGVAPTFAHAQVMLEAHLLDFEGELVGVEMEVTLRKFLRPEEKYDGMESLMAAIKSDVQEVRAFFA